MIPNMGPAEIRRLERLIFAVEQYNCKRFIDLVTLDRAEGITHYDIYNSSNALHMFICCPTQVAINPDTATRIKVIKQLLEWKVDINEQDHSGETPLYQAIYNRDVAIIPCLLANGATIRMVTSPYRSADAFTILSLAYNLEAEHDEIPIIKMLMMKGARPGELIRFDERPPNENMMKFYECIFHARRIASILMGMHRYKKSSFVSICGKDCISLIARAIYETRGDSIWIYPSLEAKF